MIEHTDRKAAEGFYWGVASGAVTTSSLVFWTRYTQAGQTAPYTLNLRVSSNPYFSKILYQGTVETDVNGIAKKEVNGLPAGLKVWYEFSIGGVVAVGKGRVLPNDWSAGARFQVITCHHYQEGFFHGLVEEPADWCIHLGDFIYEYINLGEVVRPLQFPSGAINFPMNELDLHYLHSSYRQDPYMKQFLATTTLICLMDDHDSGANDFYLGADGLYSSPTHPLKSNAIEMDKLIRSGIDIWKRWLPVVEGMVIDCGQVRFVKMDCRLHRSPHPCGELEAERIMTSGCPAQFDAQRTMVGLAQRQQLVELFSQPHEGLTVILNPVLMSRLIYYEQDGSIRYLKLDGWDGYAGERQLLLDSFALETGKRLFVTGDLHAFLNGNLFSSSGSYVGQEVMVGSLSSRTIGEELFVERPNFPARLAACNASLSYFEPFVNGFGILEITGGDEVSYCFWLKGLDRQDPSDNVEELYAVLG